MKILVHFAKSRKTECCAKPFLNGLAVRAASFALLTLLLPAGAMADEAADRAAIEKTITALNDPAAKPATMWAPGVDGTAERAKLRTGPMSEVFGGKISSRSIQFVTPRIAMVDATQTQFGSVILTRSVPLVIMLKKVRVGWRINELRVVAVPAYPAVLQIP